MYVLDENGQVVFEFTDRDGDYKLVALDKDRAKVFFLVKLALRFLKEPHHGG